MNVAQVNLFLPAVAAVAYLILALRVLLRNDQQGKHTRWFLAFVGVAVVWELILFLLWQGSTLSNIPVKVITSGTLALSVATAAYLGWPQQRRWLSLAGLTLLVALLLDLFLPREVPWFPHSILFRPTLGSGLTLLIWFSSGLVTLLRTWHSYRQTRLPWHANRLLHWLLFALVTLVGEGLIFSLTPRLHASGQLIRLVGAVGLSQAVLSHQLFDVRARLRKGIALALIGLSSALPATLVLLGSLWIVEQLALEQPYTYALILFLISVGFLLYQPFRRLVERVLYHYLLGQELQPNRIVRRYTQAISRTLDVDQLSLVIISTISELLQTNRGALMLVSQQAGGYAVDPIPALGQLARQRHHFADDSLFIQSLATEQRPVLQYDLDFNPNYAGLAPKERAWLSAQGMEVYVPVHSDQEVTGLIALGPKSSGFPYRPSELELVQVLADQTVIALQNARLYSTLNQQHDQIRHLNTDLRQQNERLETLDRVKSDFITIASHELRTPLTQVGSVLVRQVGSASTIVLVREPAGELPSARAGHSVAVGENAVHRHQPRLHASGIVDRGHAGCQPARSEWDSDVIYANEDRDDYPAGD